MLFVGSFIDNSSNAFAFNQHRMTPALGPRVVTTTTSSFSTSFSLSMSSLATTPLPSPTIIPDRAELESMKVVDLKQLIKDTGLNERGLFSKLKKKQDLVDFLTTTTTTTEQQKSVVAGDDTGGAAVTITTMGDDNDDEVVKVVKQTTKQPEALQETTPKQSKQRRTPMAMPSNTNKMNGGKKSAADDDDTTTTTTPTNKQLSPMVELFEKINEQYPPLQYLRDGNSTMQGEFDIRQRYHPMLMAGNQERVPSGEGPDNDNNENNKHKYNNENNNNNDEDTTTTVDTETNKDGWYKKPALSGDMDLIFVGTASCTPSITRGVSCTALRLHSLASSVSTSNKKKINKNFKVDSKKGKGGEQEQRFNVPPNSQSNLGTWLFDCGESTQVRYVTLYSFLIIFPFLS